MTTYGAKWSQHRCYKKDPLPEIAPALLNSYDIARYVEEECLLERDSFEPERLKTASYEMRFLGTLYDWKLEGAKLERRCRKIVDGKKVELSRNSISYLWIQEHLRLPEYIAARFNLRIRDVHKGILLGTGPLIDPGFGGRILIPLHNLTDNDYSLVGGEGIIWVEFTKVSMQDCWLPDQEGSERPPDQEGKERPPDLVEFPHEKAIDDPNRYLLKAGAASGVQSALRGALEEAKSAAGSAREAAQEARDKAEQFEARVSTFGFVGGAALLVGVVSLVVAAFVLLFSVYDFRGQVLDRVERQRERIDQLQSAFEGSQPESNASGAAGEAGDSEPSGVGVEEAVSSQEGVEPEAENPLASGRGPLPERRGSPTSRVR